MMFVVEQTAIINAPLAITIEAVNDVESIPEWATVRGVIEDVQGDGIGMTYQWRFQWSRLTFKGQAEIVDQTETRLVTKTTGDISSLWTVIANPLGHNTALRVVVEYSPPHVFIEPLADLVAQQLANPEIARQNIASFKEMVERRTESEKSLISSV